MGKMAHDYKMLSLYPGKETYLASLPTFNLSVFSACFSTDERIYLKKKVQLASVVLILNNDTKHGSSMSHAQTPNRKTKSNYYIVIS